MERYQVDSLQAEAIKNNFISFAHRYKSCILLDSSQFYSEKDLEQKKYHHSYDWIIGAGNNVEKSDSAFSLLQKIDAENNAWRFVGLAYDSKNEIEQLYSQNKDITQFPTAFALFPDIVITYRSATQEMIVYKYQFEEDIFALPPSENIESKIAKVQFTPTITKEEYIQKLHEIKYHLLRGDIYEINFCQEFAAENAELNPYQTFKKLNAISPMPFSSFFKLEDKYVLSASPERFIKKEGNRLISQPMKGTLKRSKNKEEDAQLAHQLKNSLKDQTENVMIVDLVRNDLSRLAERGTVNVDELFEVYQFPNIYQMISTISCQINENTTFTDIIKATFPMGSMTGAPKISAMQLSEKLESFKRSWYSGTLGYITPENDFDFSVLIRSVFYNEALKTVNFAVGGAITIASDAEAEYEECMLKALPIFRLFEE